MVRFSDIVGSLDRFREIVCAICCAAELRSDAAPFQCFGHDLTTELGKLDVFQRINAGLQIYPRKHLAFVDAEGRDLWKAQRKWPGSLSRA